MGKYIESNLLRNEQVRFETRLHWIIYLPGIILLLAYGIGVLFLLLAWITRATSEFGVTNKRVIIKTGWIARKTMEINLNKVEGVQVDQGIFARIFGYGTIVVRGTGGTPQSFKAVALPFEFRRAVNEALEPEETPASVPA